MKRVILLSAILLSASSFVACSRKAPQAGPAAPEVLVTTVTPQDVPRVLERVTTLDGSNCATMQHTEVKIANEWLRATANRCRCRERFASGIAAEIKRLG